MIILTIIDVDRLKIKLCDLFIIRSLIRAGFISCLGASYVNSGTVYPNFIHTGSMLYDTVGYLLAATPRGKGIGRKEKSSSGP